jgi:hypothetical protein
MFMAKLALRKISSQMQHKTAASNKPEISINERPEDIKTKCPQNSNDFLPECVDDYVPTQFKTFIFVSGA